MRLLLINQLKNKELRFVRLTARQETATRPRGTLPTLDAQRTAVVRVSHDACILKPKFCASTGSSNQTVYLSLYIEGLDRIGRQTTNKFTIVTKASCIYLDSRGQGHQNVLVATHDSQKLYDEKRQLLENFHSPSSHQPQFERHTSLL